MPKPIQKRIPIQNIIEPDQALRSHIKPVKKQQQANPPGNKILVFDHKSIVSE